MLRIVCPVGTILCCVAIGHAQQPTRPFSAATDLVVVPAVVLDRKGAVVQGLDASAFQVFEDGRQVAIEAFTTPADHALGADGRFVVLVLDNLRTRAELGPRVQTIARKFASRMGPSDAVSVITLDAGRTWTATSPAEVRAAIERFRPAFGETIRSDEQLVTQGLRAIGLLNAQLSKISHRRKVLVFIGAASMFSPSQVSAFADRDPDLSQLWYDAIRSSGRDNVTVYVIDPEISSGTVGDYSRSFAAETGGYAWANSSNFDDMVDRIWLESGSYYLLGYRLPINDHRLHKIEVKVSVPRATVRARRARG